MREEICCGRGEDDFGKNFLCRGGKGKKKEDD